MTISADAIARDPEAIAAANAYLGDYKNGHNGKSGVGELRHCTDLGNAERFVEHHKKDVRFCSQLGWLAWDGKRWNQDENGEIERRAKLTVRQIYNEAANTEDQDTREKISAHAHKSESAARISAMIELAKSEQGIPINIKELDCNHWLLNVSNGTLNLESNELKPHRREDFITKLLNVEYFPDAQCPTWEGFIARITENKDGLRRFIQKAVGYSLTASTREQCLFILYGLGANGKSTFLSVIGSLFGDYAKQTRTETLLVKRGDQIPNDVARPAGARFVSAIETESGRRLAEGLVKQLTGGDKMPIQQRNRKTLRS